MVRPGAGSAAQRGMQAASSPRTVTSECDIGRKIWAERLRGRPRAALLNSSTDSPASHPSNAPDAASRRSVGALPRKANRRVGLGGLAPVLCGSQSSPLQTTGRKVSPTARLPTQYTNHPAPSNGGWLYPAGRSTVEPSTPATRGGAALPHRPAPRRESRSRTPSNARPQCRKGVCSGGRRLPKEIFYR